MDVKYVYYISHKLSTFLSDWKPFQYSVLVNEICNNITDRDVGPSSESNKAKQKYQRVFQ